VECEDIPGFDSSKIEVKSLPSFNWPGIGTNLCFCSPQLVTSQSCKTTDTGLVHHVVCPFTPQLLLVPT